MTVKLIAVKCPSCGAKLSFEEDREKAFCSYCGTQILLTNQNNHTYRHVDEADIRRAETERLIYLKELELEEKEAERSRKGRSTAFKVAGIVAIVGVFSEIIAPYNSLGMLMIAAAAWIAILAFISMENQEKKRKKRRPISADEAMVTENMLCCEGENFNSVAARFRSAGFSNVKTVPLNDLNIFTSKKNGQVEDVSINGDDDFDEGDVFQKNAVVVIAYHSTR